MRHMRPGAIPFRQLQRELYLERGQALPVKPYRPPLGLSDAAVNRLVTAVLGVLVVATIGVVAGLMLTA